MSRCQYCGFERWKGLAALHFDQETGRVFHGPCRLVYLHELGRFPLDEGLANANARTSTQKEGCRGEKAPAQEVRRERTVPRVPRIPTREVTTRGEGLHNSKTCFQIGNESQDKGLHNGG